MNFSIRDFDTIKVTSILCFVGVAFFLVAKGLTNAVVIFLGLLALWHLATEDRDWYVGRSRLFWLMFFCLAAPFFCELIVQLGRGDFKYQSLDGPSRFLLCVLLFVWLSRKNCDSTVRALKLGSVYGIVLCSMLVYIDRGAYWDDRLANYFVDPITLPCYLTAMLTLSLFGESRRLELCKMTFIRFILIVSVIVVAYLSQSRSAWLCLIFMIFFYVIWSLDPYRKTQFITTTVILGLCVAGYFLSDVIRLRVDLAVFGVGEFLQNRGFETSTGQRLYLNLLDLHLARISPLWGFADGVLPDYATLSKEVAWLAPNIYEIKLASGSHNEMLAQLSRKGLVFGSISLNALYVLPLYISYSRIRGISDHRMETQWMLMVFVSVIAVAGLTIQVFNLKMTSSFYGLCLSILFADIVRRSEKRN